MARIAIFIDGAYLSYLLKDDFNLAKIDYNALAAKMADGIDVLRTYYYNCPPYQSPQPSDEEKARFARAQSFFTALDRLPRYEVRLGRLARRGLDENGKPVFEQKRVDIMLGMDLALLCGKNQITHAALLAGDSDFIRRERCQERGRSSSTVPWQQLPQGSVGLRGRTPAHNQSLR